MNPHCVIAARETFSTAKLLEYRGRWVAFDSAVEKIVADAETLEGLEAALVERRIDPQAVYLEYIPGVECDVFFSPETLHEVRVPE